MVPEIWSVTECFLSLWTIFCPLPPPTPSMDPGNQNFQKIKKVLEDIIILQMFTINNSHIVYGFSDMEWNRQNFLSFWTIFALLPKNQNLKN